MMTFRTSVQREMDQFFSKVNQQDFHIRSVTKSAFSKARAKLKYTAFTSLMHSTQKLFYQQAPVQNWRGFRLLAVDGSRLNLPSHTSIDREFETFGQKSKQARCSLLYDAVNLVPVDAQIDSLSVGERELLVAHLDHMQKGDLLLMDRGYPAQWLFLLLASKGIEFCARLSDYNWNEAADFAFSNKLEARVTFKVDKKHHSLLEKHGVDTDQSLTVRLVKFKLDTGVTEILCTSLTDDRKFTAEDFGALYHRRWTAEEAFKMLKSRAELENFSGKTAHAVKQDFYAKIFALSLCSMYALPIEQKVIAEYKADEKRKHARKINRTNALRATYELIVPAFIKRKFAQIIPLFDELIFKTTEIIRPNRKLPRKHKPPKRHYMAYKKL